MDSANEVSYEQVKKALEILEKWEEALAQEDICIKKNKVKRNGCLDEK